MNKKNLEKEKLRYHIMDVQYVKAMGREVKWDSKENDDLYPAGWFLNKNYAQKTLILAEAIKNKCLIEKTQRYLNIDKDIEHEENKEN